MYKLTHNTEYFDKPIIHCARNIFGIKTWEEFMLGGGGGATAPLFPCSVANAVVCYIYLIS